MKNSSQPKSDIVNLLEHINEEQSRYTTLLKLFVESNNGIHNVLQAIQGEIAEIRRDIVEIRNDITEIRADIVEIRADITEISSDIVEMRGDIAELRVDVDTLKKNQVDTYEILGDMAQSISDNVLVKKIRSKADGFKQALV